MVKKYRKSIELYQEKSGDVVRIIRFKNPKDFDYFLYGFKLMRYPGYNWRYCKKIGRKNRYHATKD
jgi:hypothetical protein